MVPAATTKETIKLGYPNAARLHRAYGLHALWVTDSVMIWTFQDRALCSYFGCTPDGESTPIPLPNPLLKRPFCNGFRGCANGKRAVVVKTKTTADSDRQDAIREEKRPFCNGFRGCANGKRSNVLDRDQLWFLQRLLENISRRERVILKYYISFP